ncbi:MAG: MerC domain-containing protein [Planctomycetota bacterium]
MPNLPSLPTVAPAGDTPASVSADDRVNARWSDRAGVAASLACAVHCALMPIAIGYLPAIGLSWVAGRGFHQGMAAFCFAAAVAAFIPGYRKHGMLLPAALGLLGVTLLGIEAFGFAGDCACCVAPGAEAAITTTLARWLPPAGGALLVVAHMLNHKYTCRCCQSGHQHAH